eukprot:SAG31_NODE_3630_length_4049_cov_2.174684_2_plen_87_part_00
MDGGYLSDCGNFTADVKVTNNSVFSKTGSVQVCAAKNAESANGAQPLSAWVAAGHDLGTRAAPWPKPSLLEKWAAESLMGAPDFER